MAKKFSIRKLLFVGMLSIAGLFGASSISMVGISNKRNNIIASEASSYYGSGIYERRNGVVYRVIYFSNRSTLGLVDGSDSGTTRGDSNNEVMHFGHGYYDWRYKYTTNSSENLNNGNGTIVEFGNTDSTGKSFNEIIGDFTAKIYLPQDVKKIKFRMTDEEEDDTARAETLEYNLSSLTSGFDEAFIITTDNYVSGTASTGSWLSQTGFSSYFYTNYITVTGGWHNGNSALLTNFVRIHSSSTGTTQYTRSTPLKSNMVVYDTEHKYQYAKFLVPRESGAAIRVQDDYNVGDGSFPSYASYFSTLYEDRIYNVTGGAYSAATATAEYSKSFSSTSAFLVGSGSFVDHNKGDDWSDQGGINIKYDSSDKGVLYDQYLEAGDVFKLKNGSTYYGWNNNDSYTDTTNFGQTSFNNSSKTSFNLYLHVDRIDYWGVNWWNNNNKQCTAAYLYNNSTGEELASWPGVQMEWKENYYFELVVTLDRPGQYTHVVFNDQFKDTDRGISPNKDPHKTEDLALPDMYNNNAYRLQNSSYAVYDGGKKTFDVHYADLEYVNKTDNIFVQNSGYYNIFLNSSSHIYIEPAYGSVIYLDLNGYRWEGDAGIDDPSQKWGYTHKMGACFYNTAATGTKKCVKMTLVNGHGGSSRIHEVKIPYVGSKMPNRVIFYCYDTFNESDYSTDWSKRTTELAPYPGKNVFKISGWDDGDNICPGSWDRFITGENRAGYFGSYFQGEIGCSYPGLVEPTGSWSDFEIEYNNMCEEAQYIVYSTEANEDGSNLEHSMATYDYIIQKYGTSSYSDFVNRIDSGSGSSTLHNAVSRNNISFNPFVIDGDASFATIIIIVASSISLLSITALSVLVIKKRKQKE